MTEPVEEQYEEFLNRSWPQAPPHALSEHNRHVVRTGSCPRCGEGSEPVPDAALEAP